MKSVPPSYIVLCVGELAKLIGLISSYFFLLLASLLSLSGGVLFSWPSPILPTLKSFDPKVNPLGRVITEDEASWLSSVLYIGAAIGPIPFGLLASVYGRKIVLLGISLLHVASFLTLAFASSFPWYCVARAFNGLAFGSSFAIIPVYLSEISEKSNRGIFTAIMQFFNEIGTLLTYSLGPYISLCLFNVTLSCFPALFFVMFLLLGPETPYFLLRKDRIEDAKNILQKLGTKVDAIEERLEEMGKLEEIGSILNVLRSKAFRKGMIISIWLRLGQDLSGINAILPYAEEIFIQAGITNLSPQISPIILALICVCCSLIVPFFVDRFGRRLILLTVTLGTTIANFSLGLFFYLKYSIQIDVTSIWWFPILCLSFYIAFWSLGLNSVPHAVSSEMFQTSIRPIVCGFLSTVNWLVAFFVTYFFVKMSHFWGECGTFWFYSCSTFLTFLFLAFYLPETKQKSFWEIQEMLAK